MVTSVLLAIKGDAAKITGSEINSILSKLVILFFFRQWWLMPVIFLKKSWNFLVFVELQFHIVPILIFRKLRKRLVQLNQAVVHIVPWVQPAITQLLYILYIYAICVCYSVPPEVTYWIGHDHSCSTSAWTWTDLRSFNIVI